MGRPPMALGTARDRHLRNIADQHGIATARMCRSVLSGMCSLAARHEALPHNPVKDLGRITGRLKTAARALTLPELRQLGAALTYDDRASPAICPTWSPSSSPPACASAKPAD